MNRRLRGLLVVALASLTLGACGSSSGGGNATTLLKQTFSGSHVVNSGNLIFSLTVNPSGSSTLKGPITLSFGGPFQSLGKGRLPASNFNISISALGKSGSLAILSTGKNGFVTLQGASYQLPAATFQKLESSFAQIGASPGGSSSGGLSTLGIDPLHWLVSPAIVGKETVGGAGTTHIRAGVNVAALLGDIDTFLAKASSLGTSGTRNLPKGISPATRTRIAGEVKNPGFEVWTGNGDKTVRKLSIRMTLPVTGQTSTLLGGLRFADIGLILQYADLNQPQSIQAPSTVRPFSEFSAKLRTLLATVQGSIGSGTGPGTTGSTGTAGSTGAGATTGATGSSGTTAKVQSYSQCIQAAGQDVARMQRCAALLNK
jgi:hypothetical protein